MMRVKWEKLLKMFEVTLQVFNTQQLKRTNHKNSHVNESLQSTVFYLKKIIKLMGQGHFCLMLIYSFFLHWLFVHVFLKFIFLFLQGVAWGGAGLWEYDFQYSWNLLI